MTTSSLPGYSMFTKEGNALMHEVVLRVTEYGKAQLEAGLSEFGNIERQKALVEVGRGMGFFACANQKNTLPADASSFFQELGSELSKRCLKEQINLCETHGEATDTDVREDAYLTIIRNLGLTSL